MTNFEHPLETLGSFGEDVADANRWLDKGITAARNWLGDIFRAEGPIDKAVTSAATGTAGITTSARSGERQPESSAPTTNMSETSSSGPDDSADRQALQMDAYAQVVAERSREEYDPSYLNQEEADLVAVMRTQTKSYVAQTVKMFDDLLATHAGDPALQAEIATAKAQTIAQIQQQLNVAESQLGAKFAGYHRQAQAEFEQLEMARIHSDLDLETKILQNEQLRQEMTGGAFFTSPGAQGILDEYNRLTAVSDPTHNINDHEAEVLAAITALADQYQYAIAVGDAARLDATPTLAVLQDKQDDLTDVDFAAFEKIINDLTLAAHGEASKLRS